MKKRKIGLYLLPHILWLGGAGVFIVGIVCSILAAQTGTSDVLVGTTVVHLPAGKQIMTAGSILFGAGVVGIIVKTFYLLKKTKPTTSPQAND